MSLINIINEYTVSNINDSIIFYKDIFDFEVEYTDGNPITWVQIKKDNIRIMLEDYQTVKKDINFFSEKVASSNLIKFEYDNFDEFTTLYNKCKTHNCSFFMDYTETEYGKIEFGILDIDNNMIIISFKKFTIK